MSSTTDNSDTVPEVDTPENAPAPQDTWQNRIRARVRDASRSDETGTALQATVEIVVIIAWAMIFARAYLDFSPAIWPLGREFGMAIQTHYIWTLLPFCGDCVFWNGFINGGSPAFAELHGAVLHPLVVVPTLIWGGLNGAKVALIGAIAMAGVAQWWLAKAMKLGLVARLWAGIMAVVGGHLAGKMEIGVVAMVISTAAATLVIAAGVDLGLSGRRRSGILFGITLALAIVSGQGYIQLGLLLAIIPAFFVFIFDRDLHLKKVWREYALGMGIALLLAGVFLLPMFHFWPNFGKDIHIDFKGAQTMGDSVLNLVITDLNVYFKEVLGTLPYPYQYITFIGWIPVLLAILTLRLAPRRQNRLLLFFVIALILVYLTASASTLRWISRVSPDLMAGIRVPSLVAGLAVPLILGLAAWSVDLLLAKDWTIAVFGPRNGSENSHSLSLNVTWILVGVLLILSVRAAFLFSKGWLETKEVNANAFKAVQEAENLNPAFTQWTEIVRGEHFWAPIALSNGLKLTNVTRPWHWKEREIPEPRLIVTRDQAAQNNPGYIGTFDDLHYVQSSDVHYAFVQTDTDVVPCDAMALGGHINVKCTTSEAGTLIVQEYVWSGWNADRDGEPVIMEPGIWLNAEVPEGTHEFHFRYRPWDVYLGLSMTIIGILLCIWLWFYQSGGDIPVPQSANEMAAEE